MKNYYWGLYWHKSQQTFGKIKAYANSFAEVQEKVIKALSMRGDISLYIIFPYGGAD